MRPRFAITLALVLAACGDTLIDHTTTIPLDDRQVPLACNPGTATCIVDGALTCPLDAVGRCGARCENCNETMAQPSSDARIACLPVPDAPSRCGLECAGGFFTCGDGCCPASAVAAGAAHTCAIVTGGRLQCWGDNREGQVTGAPTQAPVSAPTQRRASGVTAVATGAAHTCAVADGQVVCWGRGFAGEVIVRIAGAAELAAGEAHTCARAGGNVHCWANGAAPAQVANISGATTLAAGARHACAIVAGGRVLCWGANGSGQLGNASLVDSPTQPVQAIPSGTAAIAASGNHTCAAAAVPTQNGNVSNAVQCWGDQPGQLFGLSTAQTSPRDPRRDPDTSVVRDAVARLATGGSHLCVQAAADRAIECFGPDNGAGQRGDASTGGTDVSSVQGSTGAAAFATGRDHSCAVFADRSVRCWGLNAFGQLGDTTTVTPGVGGDPRPKGTPVAVIGR